MASAAFLGCQKSLPVVEPVSNANEHAYHLNGKPVQKDKIDLNNPDLLIVNIGGAKEIHCFTIDAEFEKWASTTEHKENLLKANREVLEAREFIARNDIEGEYNRTGKIPQKYTDYIKELGKIEERAAVTELFDFANYGGSVYTATPSVPYPTLGIFNDRASSMKAYVGCQLQQLCENTWFGGARYLYVACPYGEWADLNAVGFNNRASSIWQ